MDLSIIIVNWNTSALLAQCLASVYTHRPACSFDVWVVDNASRDDSVAMLRARFPQVRLIANPENRGFAGGNNQAIAQSAGRYVLLLNSDTIVQPNALTQLVTFMHTHADSGAVGAYVVNPDGTAQHSFGAFPTLLSETIYAWGLDRRAPFAVWAARPVRASASFWRTGWVLGAAMLLRRAALQQVGVLDESYFMYSEEIDLAYRIARAGWRNYVVRDARIVHLGGQSTQQMPASMKAELFRSKLKYFRKHHGRFSAWLLQGIFSASLLTRRWLYRARGNAQRSQLWAETWDYFRGQRTRPTEGHA